MNDIHSQARSHPGARRTHNEDALLDRPDLGLWVVADGAGGHQDGAFASTMIVDALGGLPPDLDAAAALAEIRARIDAVHAALLAEAEVRGPGVMIASTVVILCVRDTHFACLWAGDSRAYRLRGGIMERLTHDHSLVQELVDAGAISPEAAEAHPQANVITRAVGSGTLALDKITDALQLGDRFLLCSDGLTKSVHEPTIAALLGEDDVATRLIAAALEAHAGDNVTAVVVEVA